MYPSQHFFLGLVFALVLLFIFPQIGFIGVVLIVFSNFIDVDHYFYYIYKKKDWSLKNSYNWFIEKGKKFKSLTRKQKKKFSHPFCFFHGIEALIVFFLLGLFIHKYFFFIFIGVGFHLFLDIVWQIKYCGRIKRVSVVLDFFR